MCVESDGKLTHYHCFRKSLKTTEVSLAATCAIPHAESAAVPENNHPGGRNPGSETAGDDPGVGQWSDEESNGCLLPDDSLEEASDEPHYYSTYDVGTTREAEALGSLVEGDGSPKAPPSNTFDAKNGTSLGFRAWLQDWIQFTNQRNREIVDKFGDPDLKYSEKSTLDGAAGCPSCCGGGGSVDAFHTKPDDTFLLENYLSDPCFLPDWGMIGKEQAAEIELLSMLSRIKGCPLWLYDEIVAWAKKHFSSSFGGSNRFGTKCEPFSGVSASSLRSRKVCLDHLERESHLQKLCPVLKCISLK